MELILFYFVLKKVQNIKLFEVKVIITLNILHVSEGLCVNENNHWIQLHAVCYGKHKSLLFWPDTLKPTINYTVKTATLTTHGVCVCVCMPCTNTNLHMLQVMINTSSI